MKNNFNDKKIRSHISPMKNGVCERVFSYENNYLQERKGKLNAEEKVFVSALLIVAGLFFIGLLTMSCVFG